MSDVVYDVYAYDQYSYRWTLIKQFQGQRREAALEFGDELYREKHILAVRVIEDKTDPETGENREKKLYNRKKVDPLPKKPAAAPVRPASRSTSSGPSTRTTAPRAAVRPAEGLSPRARQAVALMMAALAIAMIALGLMVTKATGITPGVSGGFIAALGAAFALVSAGGLGLLVNSPAEREYLTSRLFELLSEKADRPAEAAPDAPAPAEQVAEAPAADLPQEEPAASVEAEEPDLVLLDPDDPDSAVSKERKSSLMGVVLGLAAVVKTWVGKLTQRPDCAQNGVLSQHVRFGVHLFVAGLSDRMARKQRWTQPEQRFVVKECLIAVFEEPQTAGRFAASFDEYLAEPRYLEMYRAGQDWDGNMVEDMPVLPEVLERWLTKSDGATMAQAVTVMFTDIVGSTAFTQEHGDKKQMELVQAHDRIVRQAIEDHRGRWVKHTGDGAMLAFERPLEALRAALQIQNEARVHNEIMPHLPLGLRIGLSAGKPIKAGDDLFGSTVQLAARVCALADTGQVVIAAAVYEACSDSGYAFASMGSKDLKGFPEPQAVYAVNGS